MVADKNGNTVVYNDKDVPIGTGTVRKVNDRSYEVSEKGRVVCVIIFHQNIGVIGREIGLKIGLVADF